MTSRLHHVSSRTEHRGSSCRERVNFCLSSDLDKMRIPRHIGACMYDAISDQKMQGKMMNRLHRVSSQTEHRGSSCRERVNFCLCSNQDKMRISHLVRACQPDAIPDHKMQGKMTNRLPLVSDRTEHRGSNWREGHGRAASLEKIEWFSSLCTWTQRHFRPGEFDQQMQPRMKVRLPLVSGRTEHRGSSCREGQGQAEFCFSADDT
jgi:hypothetical protein